MAMVHSGQFTDLGPVKYANVAENKKLCKSFTASAAGGIQSESNESQSKCFRFSKVIDKSPDELLEEIYKGKQSFIQKFALITNLSEVNGIENE